MKNKEYYIDTAKIIAVAIFLTCIIASPIIAILLIWFFTTVMLKIAGTILVLSLMSYWAFNLLESIEE